MTVIACNASVMAADSSLSDNGRRVGHVRKIYRSPSGWLGAASSNAGVCERFSAWIAGDLMGKFEPNVGDGFFGALLLRPDGGICGMGADGIIFPFDAQFAAEGRGREVAIGAMEMGASPARAIQAAITWEEGCFGPVQVERLNDV